MLKKVCASLALLAAFQCEQSLAADFFVDSVNGADTNSGEETSPVATFRKAVSLLHPGDTLFVKDGFYTASDPVSIPSGNSWEQPVTIKAAPGARPRFVPLRDDSTILLFVSANHHIILQGLVFDGRGKGHDGIKITHSGEENSNAHHIRIQDCEVMNVPNEGILISEHSDFNEIINTSVHGVGDTRLNHGMYVSSDNNTIQGNIVYDQAGWGIHVFGGSASNNVVENNIVFDNARSGDGSGIGLYTGENNIARNNVVHGHNFEGITVGYGASNTIVENNTVYGSVGHGIDIMVGAVNTQVINNISVSNGFNGIRNDSTTTRPIQTNLVSGNGAGLVDVPASKRQIRDTTGRIALRSNVLNKDPLFTNVAAHDLSLRLGSPALEAGTTVAGIFDDIVGTLRPQNGKFDIGAYEMMPPVGPHITQLTLPNVIKNLKKIKATLNLNVPVSGAPVTYKLYTNQSALSIPKSVTFAKGTKSKSFTVGTSLVLLPLKGSIWTFENGAKKVLWNGTLQGFAQN